ncbi:MAG: hypothetical protein H6Q33_5462 [Deltaproteobacteria bacterium]|nr:hypothetical protein [Deltaproteobacteria bacterium]
MVDGVTGSSGGPVLLIALTAVDVCIGAFTASSYALFMELTDPALGATQFSTFMAATNACESWSSAAVGRMIPAIGYPGAFSLLALVSLATLPVLRHLPAGGGNRNAKTISRHP